MTYLPTSTNKAIADPAQMSVDDSLRLVAQLTSAIIVMYRYVVMVALINMNFNESSNAK
tara:strand:+ start:952 stop:1128 length:177 start_codon:yes stop_codon:yes gene_type:complete